MLKRYRGCNWSQKQGDPVEVSLPQEFQKLYEAKPEEEPITFEAALTPDPVSRSDNLIPEISLSKGSTKPPLEEQSTKAKSSARSNSVVLSDYDDALSVLRDSLAGNSAQEERAPNSAMIRSMLNGGPGATTEDGWENVTLYGAGSADHGTDSTNK
ncbi:hypothetical protein QFC22_005648 [Naganishia vaughanmartiniae]|uniref:Uncharacterized protein n=1 Tax=Naganishia vaughanmartiniae TaxID=1424756 RepID=A0ACC2WT11_9TREE|nr:hypothetical protein QFC22_005648 [Naganishia vaughanmartiniae]